MIEYIVTLCEKTREEARIAQGASPRASLALTALSKATAWIQGRDYVLPRDVRFVFHDCIEHRLIWPQEITSPAEKDAVLEELFTSVKPPVIK
jgi:MoxR-like ATPase